MILTGRNVHALGTRKTTHEAEAPNVPPYTRNVAGYCPKRLLGRLLSWLFSDCCYSLYGMLSSAKAKAKVHAMMATACASDNPGVGVTSAQITLE